MEENNIHVFILEYTRVKWPVAKDNRIKWRQEYMYYKQAYYNW